MCYNLFFLVILLCELNKTVVSDESEERKSWKHSVSNYIVVAKFESSELSRQQVRNVAKINFSCHKFCNYQTPETVSITACRHVGSYLVFMSRIARKGIRPAYIFKEMVTQVGKSYLVFIVRRQFNDLYFW